MKNFLSKLDVARCAQELGIEASVPCELSQSMRSANLLGVTCSGGVDSVALLMWLWANLPSERLLVVHFDHRLRGRESAADRAFVERLSSDLGLECISDSWGEVRMDPSEADLREARFAFFRRVASERNIKTFLTGHHLDDVLETFFMRLLRGVGSHGLSVPRVESQGPGGLHFSRPFIDIRKAVLIAFCERLEQPWREDASNGSDRYLRNAIRKTVAPPFEKVAEQFGRDAARLVGQSRRILQQDADIADWAVRKALEESLDMDSQSLVLIPLLGIPPVLQGRVIVHWLRTFHDLEISRNALETIVSRIKEETPPRNQAIADGYEVQWANGALELVSWSEDRSEQFFPFCESVPYCRSELYLPGHRRLIMEPRVLSEEEQRVILSGSVDCKIEAWLQLPPGKRLIVRNRREGDRFHALGAPGSKKLKDILNQRKIALSERNSLPIVTAENNHVLWVPGLPPSETARITPSTKHALRLTYTVL